MSDLQSIIAFLDQVKATADAASAGPWHWHHEDEWYLVTDKITSVIPGIEAFDDLAERPNAIFIASSRQRIPQLEQALRVAVGVILAAQRLAAGNHRSWANSGGPDECEHGYAKGIPCPKCDSKLLSEALHKIATLCHE
jgi:hypothetical protein